MMMTADTARAEFDLTGDSTMTTVNLIAQIVSACPHRLHSRDARIRAQDHASRILSPVVPDGTLQWLVVPDAGESAQSYAERAVYYADCRSAWAGGLKVEGPR